MPQDNREILPNGRETKFYTVGLQILASHPDAKLVVERAPEDGGSPGTPNEARARVIDEQPAPGPWTLKDNIFVVKFDDRSIDDKPWFYRFRQVSTSYQDSDWWPSNSTWLKVTPERKDKEYQVPAPPPYPLAIIKQNDIPGEPESVRITLQPFPEHDDIVMKYQVVDAATGQPARGDGSWTTYSGAFDQARDDVDRDKIFAYADLNNITKGPVSGELIETDRRPMVVNISLAIDDAGNVDATVTADADTGSVRVAADTAGFPDKTTTQGASATNLTAGVADVQDVIALQPGETAFVSVLPYSRAAGAGAEGEMAQAKITMSDGFFDNAIERVLVFQRGDHLYASVRAGSLVESIKFATSTSSFPAAGTGTCQDLDADASVSVDLGAFLYADEVYITITPYDAITCGGNQGREHQMRHQLETDDKLFDEGTGDINPKRIDSDQLTLGSWQTQAVPNLGSYASGPNADEASFQIRWDDSNSRLYLKLVGNSLVSDASVKWKLVLKGNGSFDSFTDFSLEAGEGINFPSTTEAESDDGGGTPSFWWVPSSQDDIAYISMSGVDDSTRILLKIIGTNDKAHGVLDQITYGGAILETGVDVDESAGDKPFEHEFLLKAEITATKINVTQLSAITADVGILTAGRIEQGGAGGDTFIDLDAGLGATDVFLQVNTDRLKIFGDGGISAVGTARLSFLRIEDVENQTPGGSAELTGRVLLRDAVSFDGDLLTNEPEPPADLIEVVQGDFFAYAASDVSPVESKGKILSIDEYAASTSGTENAESDSWAAGDDPDGTADGENVLAFTPDGNGHVNQTKQIFAANRLNNTVISGGSPSSAFDDKYTLEFRIDHETGSHVAGLDGDSWSTTVEIEVNIDGGGWESTGVTATKTGIPSSGTSTTKYIRTVTLSSTPSTSLAFRLKTTSTCSVTAGTLTAPVEARSQVYDATGIGTDPFSIDWTSVSGGTSQTRRGLRLFGATDRPHLRMVPLSAKPADADGIEGDIVSVAGTENKIFYHDGTSYVNLTAGGVGGTGTTDRLAKFTASSTIGDSLLRDDGTDTFVVSGSLIFEEDAFQQIISDRNPAGAGTALLSVEGRWNGDDVAMIVLASGADTGNKDDGRIRFFTQPDNVTGLVERWAILEDGSLSYVTTPSAGDDLIVLKDAGGHDHVLEASSNDGIVLRTLTNPASSSPIFAVHSSGDEERFRVDHEGFLRARGDGLLLTDSASATGANSEFQVFVGTADVAEIRYKDVMVFELTATDEMKMNKSAELWLGDGQQNEGVGGINLVRHCLWENQFVARETISKGNVVKLEDQGSGVGWYNGNAGNLDGSRSWLLGVAMEAGSAGNPMKVALYGEICLVSEFGFTGNTGEALYVPSGQGVHRPVSTPPTGGQITIIGWMINADCIFVHPQYLGEF